MEYRKILEERTRLFNKINDLEKAKATLGKHTPQMDYNKYQECKRKSCEIKNQRKELKNKYKFYSAILKAKDSDKNEI